MNPSLCSDSFVFREVHFRERHYNDARRGNDCHYIGYMRVGRAKLVTESGVLPIREGELFYIPMGLRYESFWEGEPEICFDSYAFSYFPHPTGARYRLQSVPMLPEICAALEALAEHRTVDCHSVSCLYLLLEKMLPHMHFVGAGAREGEVEKAIAYMQGHDAISVPLLARECRVSESGLYAAFRETRGCTPIEMWHRILAERAVILLRSTDLSVEEISVRLGFCSASYFRKILRRVTGKTPREIRSFVRM